jgi:hypothetical protein
MKTLYSHFRLFAALALAIELGGCGGTTTVNLGGTVTGLTTNGLVLANGGNTVAVPANAVSYTFPNQIDDQAVYTVTIQTQPKGLTCSLVNASGNANGIDITNVNVSCVQNTYNLGGTISGLTTAGLVLTNGSDTVSPAASATTFAFPTKVADGAVYGVAVLAQSAGLTCTVRNGTAVMGSADVGSVQVNCM